MLKPTDATTSQVSSAGLPEQTRRETYWDAVALTRWGQYLIEWERKLAAKASDLAGNPTRGIDLGCGSGRWTRLLSDRGWQMTCIDVVAADLEVCRRNNPQANCLLVPMDSTKIPCETNSAKMLLCIEVSPVSESNWFIPESARVLGPGGVLLSVMCNGHSWRGPASRLWYHLRGNQGDYKFYNRDYRKVRRQLLESGFEMVFEEGACWAPAGRESNSALVPFYAKMERILGLHRAIDWSPWVGFVARKKA